MLRTIVCVLFFLFCNNVQGENVTTFVYTSNMVGGGGNQFTELRRNLKRNARNSVKTPRILSSFEVRGFYIKISHDGLIEFGKEGETLPLLQYNDINPLEIKYFSFAAWTGVEAKFLYDCPIPTGGSSPNSKEIEPSMSISDQLKRTLLLYRLPWIPPKPTMDVKSWTDESMSWYSGKYGNITSLKFRQGQIWRPKFYIFNSDKQMPLEAMYSDLVSMANTGEATFHFQSTVSTWCVDTPPGYSKWPRDEYLCSIVIQPWEAHEKISIDIIEPNNSKMHIFSDVDKQIENQWEVSIKQLVIKPTVWNQVYISDDNETHQSDRLILSLQLKRRATAFNIVFYTPLLVLLMFVLMSFWSEPLTMERIWFLAGCTIVITMGLCYMDFLIPSHLIPSILIFYTTVLMGVLIALLIQALLITDVFEKFRNLAFVQKILNAHVFRIIFWLPAYTVCSKSNLIISILKHNTLCVCHANFQKSSNRNGGYSLQEDEEPQSPITRGDVEEMEKETPRTCGDKKELAEVIDKIMFVIYFVTFISMLAAHY
ncbi:hypothetical protein HF086_003029 [Spodoptera exigua]|uniref:Uncharacterized protein n=1 Tax=Spodoptera exigua TaxID=7107 RepID=A0A922SKY3_SPOEX|nr:hypothetical protein HF086_003029 [Spodoptera exigua]